MRRTPVLYSFDHGGSAYGIMKTRRKRWWHPASCASWVFFLLLCRSASPPAAAAGQLGSAEVSLANKGKEIYQMYCANCHGANGAGNGPTAAGLVPRPADFTNPRLMAKSTDAELREFILEGGGPKHNCPTMPSWAPILREEDVTGVVAYLRTLAR